MAPFKLGCRGVWGVRRLKEVGEFRSIAGGKGTLHGTILTKIRICLPPSVKCRMVPIGDRRLVVLLCLSHIDGVSFSTSSYMWGHWYFPQFLLRDGSLTLWLLW